MREREISTPAFAEQELSEPDQEKLKLLDQAGNTFLDSASEILEKPDFCQKIDERFKTQVEKIFPAEAHKDLKEELLNNSAEIKAEFDIIYDRQSLKDRIEEGEIPPGQYSSEDLEGLIIKSLEEDEDLKVTRSEFRRLITAIYGISFFSLMGRIDRQAALAPGRFKGFIKKTVPDPNQNKKFYDFIESLYFDYARNDMRKFASIAQVQEFTESLESEMGEKFKKHMQRIEYLIPEDAVSAEDLCSFYQIEKDKYDQKRAAGEKFYGDENYALENFIWRGCYRDDQKIQERAHILKETLPDLQGEITEIVADSLFQMLVVSSDNLAVLKEILQEENETSAKIKKKARKTIEERISATAWYRDYLKEGPAPLVQLFEGEERKKIEEEVGIFILKKLKNVFYRKENFRHSLEELRATVTDIDILAKLSQSFLQETKSPEYQRMAVESFRDLFQDTPLLEKIKQTLEDVEKETARALICDAFLCPDALKQKIITQATERDVLSRGIPIYPFLERTKIEEKDLDSLLVFLENQERVQFFQENQENFQSYDYRKPNELKEVLHLLNQWYENPDLLALAKKLKQKLFLSSFENLKRTVDESGVKTADLLDFINRSKDVIKYGRGDLLNQIKMAAEWHKNPESLQLAQTLAQKLGLKVSSQEFESYARYAQDPEIKSQSFINATQEFAEQWPRGNLHSIKAVYDLVQEGKMNFIRPFLEKAGLTLDAFENCDAFLETCRNIVPLMEKVKSTQERYICDACFLKEHLSFYQKEKNQPRQSKEKPDQIEFNRLVREFDGVGLRLAIFGLEEWGVNAPERRKIFGADVISSIEKIKKSMRTTPLDTALYNFYGRGEGKDYCLRFHGTKSRDIAKAIATHGQMIGHRTGTGSYSGNLDTAWSYCASSGSVVSYTREDLRDSYINYGIESQCNAVDTEKRYTRVPSRIIYNVSADQKENALEEALKIYRVRKAVEEKPDLVKKIREKFQTFMREQGETFQNNLEAIYRQMRARDYGEPKILEVADFYLRQILGSEHNASAQKRKIALEKILEVVRKDPTQETAPDIAITSDCLMEYDELIPEPEETAPQEKGEISRKARLARPLLFDQPVRKLAGMNASQIERLLQKRVLRIQIEATRKALEDQNNQVINGLFNQVEKYISLQGLKEDEADKLRQKIKGHRALFLGEMNGDNLEVANKAVLKIREDLKTFHHDILKLAVEKIETQFTDSEIHSRYKDRFEWVLTGSAGRGDATLKSDLDCLAIFNDEGIPPEEKEKIAAFFNQASKPALNSFLQEIGYYPDVGKAQAKESAVAFRSDLKSLVIDPSVPVSTRLKIEPTNIIDLVSVSGDQKGLVAMFKKEFLERFSDVSQQEYLAKGLERDIAQKHMQEWYKGFSQLLSGDRVRNLKTELIRILDFNLFQSIAANLHKIKETKGEDFIVPADNQEKIAILQEIGVLSGKQAEILKQATLDLFRWRLRNEIIQKEEMDPALLTNKERERATEYAKVMNALIKSLVLQRGGGMKPIIS